MNTEDWSQIAGGVIIGGFDGIALPAVVRDQLAQGRLAGVTLFKRNVSDIEQTAALCSDIVDATQGAPPLISIDQEGGRVARLGPPVTQLPPMRVLGQIDDPALTRSVGQLLAEALTAIGINLDFAPVADVDSNPDNPVIGDRAFGADPDLASRHVVALIEGMQQHGLLACAKHFPGHGDTVQDSHLELPHVTANRTRLEVVELVPFRAAVRANVASFMTAHVVYRELDPGAPATLSRYIVTQLLRNELHFGGVCFSDDLQMKAISARQTIESAGLGAIEAGCDALLICADPQVQERTRSALEDRARRDPQFAARLREAYGRVTAMRHRAPPHPARDPGRLHAVLRSTAHQSVAQTLASRAASFKHGSGS